MDNLEIWENYLKNIKEYLEKDDFDSLDYILHEIYTSEFLLNELALKIDEILQEITLYVELKDKEYKETALDLINKFKLTLNI